MPFLVYTLCLPHIIGLFNRVLGSVCVLAPTQSCPTPKLQGVLHVLFVFWCTRGRYLCSPHLYGVQGPKAVHPSNVLRDPLPNAKDFRVYCMYGVNTPTERGYHYLKTRKEGAGGTVHTEWSINHVADDPKSGLVRLL